jgi:hypothetical protein
MWESVISIYVQSDANNHTLRLNSVAGDGMKGDIKQIIDLWDISLPNLSGSIDGI